MLPRETDTDVFIRSQNIKNSQLIVDILITFTFTHQTLRYIVCSYFKGKSIKYWRSMHRNCKEDRIHYFYCGSSPDSYGYDDCAWRLLRE